MAEAEQDHKPRRNRVPWIVIGVLIVLFAAGGILASSSKESKGGHPGARLVLVPTADRARLVVVPPCNTGAPLTTRAAEEAQQLQGSITISLPRGTGIRAVLVPQCVAGQGAAANQGANVPSAAFVLRIGAPRPASGSNGVGSVQAQLLVPDSSPATTIVVPPCTKQPPKKASSGNGRTTVLGPPSGGGQTAVAPPC